MHSRTAFDGSFLSCAQQYVKSARLPGSYGKGFLAPGFTRRIALLREHLLVDISLTARRRTRLTKARARRSARDLTRINRARLAQRRI